MRYLFIILAFVSLSASAQFMTTAGGGPSTQGDDGYVHRNGFETQADDDDWTAGGNAPDFDNAFSMKGSECMEQTANESAAISVTARAETWVTFMMRTNDNNEGTENFFLLYNDATALATLLYENDNNMKVQAAGGTLSGGETVSVNSSIQYIKIRYKQGTGANAEVEFWASTDGTNWAKNLTSTDGTETLQFNRIVIQNTHDTEVMRIDNFIENDADITDAT